MIRLDSHNFLRPSLCKELIEAGVDMSDSRYVIYEGRGIVERIGLSAGTLDYSPTYTLPEILYKLYEYLPSHGPLGFQKDAPFYYWGYGEFGVYSETPIESAARLLLRCAKDGVGYVNDIRGKYEQ